MVNSGSFMEFIVEQAAMAWLEAAGWQVRNGAEIAPSEPRVKEAERALKETTA